MYTTMCITILVFRESLLQAEVRYNTFDRAQIGNDRDCGR